MKRTHGLATLLALMVGATLLGGCAGGPGIPDTIYFRLDEPVVIAPASGGQLDGPLVIETFLADGVHSDQAILYSTDVDGDRIRAYHYQLWVDPPTRMLQRRLIRYLDAARIAPLVVDRLPPGAGQYRLQLRIEAFERVRSATGWTLRVGVEARFEQPGDLLPRLQKRYAGERAAGEGIRDSVAVAAQVLDVLYAELASDLLAAGKQNAQ